MQPTDTRLGVLYPGYAGERDYHRYGELHQPKVRVEIAHVPWTNNPDSTAAIKDLGAPDQLFASASELRHFQPDVAVWACTSGSFLWGRDGMKQQVQHISEALQVPATTTTLAYLNALEHLQVTRVAIGSIYETEIIQSFIRLLELASIKVVSLLQLDPGNRDYFINCPETRNQKDPVADLAEWPEDAFKRIADRCNSDSAEAILIPETAFQSADVTVSLEKRLRKPVLLANHVTVWSALKLAGSYISQPHLGILFTY